MKVQTREIPIGAFYGETVTLAAAVKALTAPVGSRMVQMNGANVFRAQLGPKISQVLKSANGGRTFTDYTSAAVDKDAATHVDLSSLSTGALNSFWYVTCKRPFSGVYIDVDGVNTNASVMTGYVWTGSAWTLTTIVDGTIAPAGTTLGQDGVVTWTAPAEWKPMTLNGKEKEYVMRFQVDAALDASTTIDSICALPNSTLEPYGYFAAATDYIFAIDPDAVGCLCALDAAAGALNVTWMKNDPEATG